MKNKLGILFIFVFILSFGAATNTFVHASNTKTQADVNLTFWWTEGTVEGALYTQLIHEFEQQNPGITVTDTQKGYFDQPNEWNTAYTAGTAPDVMRADVTWITNWANDGKIIAIDPHNITDFTDFTHESIEKTMWNGQVYGIPQVVDALGMFYNKHFFSAAGVNVTADGFQSFQAFADAGQTLLSWAASSYDAGNQTASQFSPFNMQGYTYAFLPIMFGFGADYFKDNNVTRANIDFNTTAWTNALTFLKSILPGGSQAMTPPVNEQGWSNIDSYFKTGRVAMDFMGPWATSDYLANGPMFNATAYKAAFGASTAPSWVNADNLGFMKVPKGVNQGIYSGGHAYVISKKSAHPVEALKLANFLAGPEADYLRSKVNHLVSPRMSTYSSDFNTTDSYVPANDPITNGFRLNLNTGITRPVHPYYFDIDGLVATQLEAFRAGNTTVQETINNMVTKANAYFDVNPELIGGAGAYPDLSVSSTTSATSSVSVSKSTASPGFEFFSVLALLSALVVFKKRKEFF